MRMTCYLPLLVLLACTDSQRPTAMVPSEETPIPSSEQTFAESSTAALSESCYFFWRDLDDDTTVHRIDSSFVARIYTQPDNVFYDSTSVQVVDLRFPPDTPWEFQYTDIENDLIHFTCTTDVYVTMEFPNQAYPPWVFDKNGRVRFETREWKWGPFQDSLVMAFRGPLEEDSVRESSDSTHFALSLVDGQGDTLVSTQVTVRAIVGEPEGIDRPWCRFVWEEPGDDSVVIHDVEEYIGVVYEHNGIPLPGQDDKQIVDMRNTYLGEENDADPDDNRIRWSCRHDRLAQLDLVVPEGRSLPGWALDTLRNNRFSLETLPPDDSDWVVAFRGPLSYYRALGVAKLSLELRDPFSPALLGSAPLQVHPRCLRGPLKRDAIPACFIRQEER